MITLEELATKVTEIERKLANFSAEGEGQDRLNTRLLGMVQEVRDEVSSISEDVKLLRRHSVASGKVLEEMEARLAKLDKLDGKFDKLESKFDKLDLSFSNFQRDLPAMMAEAMREVARENKKN